jgi:AraC-like DNA-binding protein
MTSQLLAGHFGNICQDNMSSKIWPVWKNSVQKEIVFTAISRKAAQRIWHKARAWEQNSHHKGKHGGIIGKSALAVLQTLLTDFLNFRSGRLDPSVHAIASKAAVSERTAYTALQRLRSLKILSWVRRCRHDRDSNGRFCLRQDTNAYQVHESKEWNPWEPAAPPLPELDTAGFPARVLDALESSAINLQTHKQIHAYSVLAEDETDPLARALAGLARAMSII